MMMTDLYKLLELAESSLSDYYAGAQYSKYDKEILEAVRKALAEKPAPVAQPLTDELVAGLKLAVSIIGHPDDDTSKALSELIAKATGQEYQPAAGRTPAST
jgi:hypothetical protein